MTQRIGHSRPTIGEPETLRACRACQEVKPICHFEKVGEKYRKRVCLDCNNESNRAKYANDHAERRSKILKRTRGDYAAAKAAVFSHYGRECACCGETEPLFLTMDHVNNDGARHRKTPGQSSHNNIYGWLVRNGFPGGFQVLCMNCNQGKHRNGGICPHAQKVQRLGREAVASSDAKHLGSHVETKM